jgi:ribA/ribD-fused uncharacterized protein
MKFRKEYAFLSNFYACPVAFEGYLHPSAEHAYQAAKTEDENERRVIRTAETPGDAKRLGREITLRPNWEETKMRFMREVIISKFKYHHAIAEQLLNTGDEELVEENWRGDTFWGVCNGVGENHLGKILMKVRDELKAASNG